MNMEYRKGEIVGYVTVREARLAVPVPRRWFLRCCTPGQDARVVERLRLLDVSAWSPTIVRFIDRRTGKVAAKPHLGKRVEKPFLPGLIFIPDFDANSAAMRNGVADLGDFLCVPVSGGLRDEYRFASLPIEQMAELRDIVDAENAARFGRGCRGKAKFRPGDKICIVDADSPLFGFAAEVERGVDSRGRLRAFIAALVGGASAELSETQVEPA